MTTPHRTGNANPEAPEMSANPTPTCDNKSGPGGVGSTSRGLTHLSDSAGRGLGVSLPTETTDPAPTPLDYIRAVVAAMTVHITAHPDNVQAITDAANQPGMPPIEVHESSLTPLDQMYVWTGDQIAGRYNVHAVPEAQQ